MGQSVNVRNVALVGPNGSGKTTLLESLLFTAGAIARKGRVADGTTVGDSSAEARARQMSTEVSAATFAYDGTSFTVLDCPGSVEFAHEARAVLDGVDVAVVVVEPVLERMIAVAPLLHDLDARRIPHIVVVNKMDRSEVRWRDILAKLREVSSRPIVAHSYAIGRGEDLVGYIDLVTETAYQFARGAPAGQIPLPAEYRERERAARQEMLETLADHDDALMEKLLEDLAPDPDEIVRDLRLELSADQVVPVLLTVAEHDMGVRKLLRTLRELGPEPAETAARLGIAADGPPLVQILKTYHMPHAGKLSLARVWRGEVKDGAMLGGSRVSGVLSLVGAQTHGAGTARAGDIVGLGRMEDVRTGQILGDGAPKSLQPSAAPKPMFAFALKAANRNDEVKLSSAFHKLAEEDPGLVLEQSPDTHQLLLWGQGEMHLRVALDRLRSKYHVDVLPEPPRTPYKETIKKGTASHGRHKKQSGGHGQFGDVKIEIRPRGRGDGFAFENKVVGGSVPKQFIPAVEEGAKDFLRKGPLGFPVVDVAVTLTDGQFHSVDSNELSFKMATAMALKEGLPACQPVLLEPILQVTVSVPSDYTSRALQLVSGKRGQILGYEGKDGWSGWDEIRVNIPQSEMHDLIVALRSLSQGTGFFEWSFDHLDEVPERLTQAIVAQVQRQHAEA